MEPKKQPGAGALWKYVKLYALFAFGGLFLFSIGNHGHGYEMRDMAYGTYLLMITVTFLAIGIRKNKGKNKFYFLALLLIIACIAYQGIAALQ